MVAVNDDLPRLDQLAFLEEFYRVGEELGELLNLDHQDETSPMMEHLQRRYRDILQYERQGNVLSRFLIGRLAILSRNLKAIREERPQLFSEFVVTFHQIGLGQYFGWRCEVDTAKFLINTGAEFTHPDPPDFRVDAESGSITIECTSSHYSGSSRSIEEKVKDAVTSKAEMEYSEPSTAIFLELTNIYPTAISRDEEFGSDELKRWVRERCDLFDYDVGSVVLLGYVAEFDVPRVQQVVDRVDINPSDELLKFLDEHVAHGEGQSGKKKRFFYYEP